MPIPSTPLDVHLVLFVIHLGSRGPHEDIHVALTCTGVRDAKGKRSGDRIAFKSSLPQIPAGRAG
jgi:hypothetical protein